ncbi:hypothetical protein HHK36_025817 [Tetracentron sinense]|uniref:EF-hand domain-containing protein n=1 Tax=Tetracentron sinense TaxID=13715 RepID=A0A835D3W8_TETSI|nr:hypothetical protein HHK36_025817 [Tetracentron sinense]
MAGLINTFFYLPPKKFLAWFGSLILPDNSSAISTTTVMETKEIKGTHDKAELERVFATFDKNGDGCITKQELGESLRNIGLFITDKEVADMVEKLDSNGDGLIDIDEFFELYESLGSRGEASGKDGLKENDGEEDLKEAFDVFDGNGDGLISVEELSLVLSSLGLKKGMRIEDCKEMIKNVDIDGDGMVNFSEFKQMMKSGTRLVAVS